MIPDESSACGENPALVVIDMQQGVFDADPESPMACTGTSIDGGFRSVVENTNRLVDAARKADIPIIWGKEAHREDLADYGAEFASSEPIHALESSPRIALASELDVDESDFEPAEYVVVKRRYDLFFRTDLPHLLKTYEIDTVILAGIMTHVCVHYTAHGAHQRDYLFRVVEDCTASPTKELHQAGLKLSRYLQPEGVQSLSNVLTDLRQYDGNAIVEHVKETGRVRSVS